MQLETKIRSVVLEMSLSARFGAAMIAGDSDLNRTERFLQRAMSTVHEPLYLMLARLDGIAVGANRWSNGEVVVGQSRPLNNTLDGMPAGNLTFWFAGANDSRGTYLGTIPYDILQRPWFLACQKNGFKTTFTAPYVHVPEPFIGVSLAIPVRDSGGVLKGVFAVDYSLQSIQAALKDAYDALESSGIIVLVDEWSGQLLATVGSLDIDKPSVVALAHTVTRTSKSPVKQTLPHFGSCFVVTIDISGTDIDDSFIADGLSWRLMIAIPEKEYYGSLWDNNVNMALLLGGSALVLLITKALLFQTLLNLPLRKMRKRLELLKESVVSSSQNLRNVRSEKPSIFAEIQGLQLAAIDALVAVEEVSRLRSQEAAQAAEAERAKEHAEAMMKSKEMFRDWLKFVSEIFFTTF